MRKPLTVAAVQLTCAAHEQRATPRFTRSPCAPRRPGWSCFPELSLTGYELDARVVAPDDPALTPIVDACAEMGSIALVGAPVAGDEGRAFIAMLRVDADGVQVAYRKTWLGGRESDRFSSGDRPVVLAIDGWRLGLAICKDTGAAQHTAGTVALGIDVYGAGLVHRPEELPEQEARAVVVARSCRAHVVFASFAGSTGDVFSETVGCSAIWSPDGLAIARAGPDPGDSARATLS